MPPEALIAIALSGLFVLAMLLRKRRRAAAGTRPKHRRDMDAVRRAGGESSSGEPD